MVSAHGVVGYVEGVVLGRHGGVYPAFGDERVLLAADHVDLGDQQTVDVPRDAPAYVTCTHTIIYRLHNTARYIFSR